MILKKIFILSAFVLFSLLSCSSPYDQKYFIQQQNRSNKDGGGSPGGDVDYGDGDLSPDKPLEGNEKSMFSVILTNGAIKEDLFTTAQTAFRDTWKKNLADQGGNGKNIFGLFGNASVSSSAAVRGKLIRASFSSANVPTMWFEGESGWNPGDAAFNESRYKGPNTTAGSFNVSDMNYYRYEGINPFFKKDDPYNTAKYDGGTETRMERFVFYRFTGNGGGFVSLNNWLVAVDTYSGLIFSFGKPTKFTSAAGQQVPSAWAPVDVVCAGPGGKRYKFYEYDPAGYVNDNGKFVMASWYTDSMGRGNYDPQFTGASPYLGTVGGEGAGGSGPVGYPVSGSLTVTAKYLKNNSMTDVWGDHGNADGTNCPEFIYDIRSRAYVGLGKDVPADSLSSYKPGETTMMPSGAIIIKTGTTYNLGGAKKYIFENTQDDLSLELDARVAEIDIAGNDWITDYETPLIFFGYDRFTQTWKPTMDNKTYQKGFVTYDKKDFSVGINETKDFIITYPAGSGEEVSVCYTLKWESSTVTAAGKIIAAKLDLKTNDFSFSGNNGAYDLVRTDMDDADSLAPCPVELTLSLGNLDSKIPVVVKAVYLSGENGEQLVNEIKLNDSLTPAICTAGKETVSVKFNMAANPTITQNGTIELLFDYGEVYDTVNSPKKMTIAVKRNSFVKSPRGKITVSGLNIKNISVKDALADLGSAGAGADGYNTSEFIWDVKTRYNTGVAADFSVERSAKKIPVGRTYSLPSAVNSYVIETPRSGTHKIVLDVALSESDNVSSNDIIVKTGQPLLQLTYNVMSDSWEYTGETARYFTDNDNNQWELKSAVMEPVGRGETQTLTVVVSGYISDFIWESLVSPGAAGWGDVELKFSVRWEGL